MQIKKFILPVLCLFILIPITSLAGKLYKWVDEKGVIHVTDDPEKIPKGHTGSLKESTPENNPDRLLIKLEDIWKYIKSRKGIIAVGIAGLLVITLFYRLLKHTEYKLNKKKREERLKALERSGVDHLDLAQFQEYIRALLTNQGFILRTPEGAFDLGVDLIAEKDKVKYAVRIRRQSGPISKTVVNDLDREKHRYGCDKAMIINNNYFSDDAMETSRLSECMLVDREKLGEWILLFEKKEQMPKAL